jgi:hypothetical protein
LSRSVKIQTWLSLLIRRARGTTAILVTTAAPTTAPGQPTTITNADNTMLIAGSTVAIIVAIAIVGLLLLRKKP